MPQGKLSRGRGPLTACPVLSFVGLHTEGMLDVSVVLLITIVTMIMILIINSKVQHHCIASNCS